MTPAPLLGLRWAIKRSFLDYIARAPGGRGALTDGAVATPDREIIFSPEAIDRTPTGKILSFRGTATFSAHSGALLVPIKNPRAELHGDTGVLTVADPFDREGKKRLNLALFEIGDHLVADGYEHFAASNVKLAPEACGLFNSVYPEFTPLDPLTIILAAQSTGTHV
jgi:hypothetical protein